MKLFNLMTYQQFINQHKAYKQIGQRHYFQYCEIMDEYINKVCRKCKLIDEIQINTEYANMYYRMNVNPNFGR